jgi:phage-related protein
MINSHRIIQKWSKRLNCWKKNHRWSKIIRDVQQCVQNCYTCKKIKTTRDKYHELLNFLSMLDQSWTNIIFDFVTKLFNSRNYNVIFMIVNKLNKIHYYILCTTNENETTIEKIIKLFIQHVWKLHELFITMISNKVFQFIFLIKNTIYKMLKIKTKLFIAFYSKTNEQSEFFNQKIKWYLRIYINYQ